jgi:long-chain-fatty-acid--CoA ligase ACSBG
MHSHDNLMYGQIVLTKQGQRDSPEFLTRDNRVLSYLPLNHVAGMSDILGPMTYGSQVYFAQPDIFIKNTLVDSLKWCRPTIFFGVPRIYEKFEEKLKEAEANAPSLVKSLLGWGRKHGHKGYEAYVADQDAPFVWSVADKLVLNPIKKAVGLGECVILMYGAAPLKQSTVDYFLSLGLPIMNMYGMTETSSCASCHSKYRTSMNAAGFALPGTDVKIANPDEKGEGEIRMLGRNTMMGYFKNEEACKSTFDENGYVMSGDLGTVDKDGWIRITGRIKELIITAGGENIGPV